MSGIVDMVVNFFNQLTNINIIPNFSVGSLLFFIIGFVVVSFFVRRLI